MLLHPPPRRDYVQQYSTVKVKITEISSCCYIIAIESYCVVPKTYDIAQGIH